MVRELYFRLLKLLFLEMMVQRLLQYVMDSAHLWQNNSLNTWNWHLTTGNPYCIYIWWQKPQCFVVQFTVLSMERLLIVLYGNVLPQIIEPNITWPIVTNRSSSLALADSIPATGGSTTDAILVGSDYFWDIVDGERVVLFSGLLLLKSKFGYILTGRYFRQYNRRWHI